MLNTYTAKFTRVESGYMGQLVEWPEVVTEGRNLEECRDMLRDALNEMILAYHQQGKGKIHEHRRNNGFSTPI